MDADIGLIGLAVMGENLALNLESKGYSVAIYNKEPDAVGNFISGKGKGKNFIGTFSLAELTKAVKPPRKIMLMIKAGSPVDEVIEGLLPFLTKGDIIIDGGNSNYLDTVRRVEYAESKGLRFIGTGVSGGEEGALNGASIMPGGSQAAWKDVKEILRAISAKADGEPCCYWMGGGGAGHFVKMVHNGIEYGDMQIICEAYHIMKDLLGLCEQEISGIFTEWDSGDLKSYLINISAAIFKFRDEKGEYVVNKILDTAGQKGTGKWTAINALQKDVPLPLITEAVFARFISCLKDERTAASRLFPKAAQKSGVDKKGLLTALERAVFLSKIVSYAQGFSLLKNAADEYGWNFNFSNIAKCWRNGCIIRSAFLDKISDAFLEKPDLVNIIQAPYFAKILCDGQKMWREICIQAINAEIPVPAIGSALSYFDSYKSENLPVNLLQAQRDYFGAHTFERVDKERGRFFHENWTGRGGATHSTTYKA